MALEVSNFFARLLESLRLSSLHQRLLGNFRFLRWADAPAIAKDEIPSDPGGDQKSRGRGGQEPEASFRAGRRPNQGDDARGVDRAVDGGRRPRGMLARNGKPVDPAHDACCDGGGSCRPGGDSAQWLRDFIVPYPPPRLNRKRSRNQDSRTIRQDRVDGMTVHNRMLW